MKLRFPSYERCDFSPAIDAAAEGIVLTAPPILEESTSLPLCGVFQIKTEMAQTIAGGNPHRAVAVLIVDTSGYHPYAFSAAGKAILFEPAYSPAGFYRGYFNVDAFQMARIPPHSGRFFVSAYLGRLQSVPFAVEWPPQQVQRK